MTNKSTLNRYQWIDLFKGLAIIAVVVDHAFFYNLYGNRTIQFLSSFSVTLFIFIAGITSALSLSRRESVNYKYFVNRLLSILIPYSISTLIYHLVSKSGSFVLPEFLHTLLTFSAAAPYYYIAFFIQLVLISGVLFSILNKRPLWFQAIILIVIAWASVYLNNHTTISSLYGGGAILFGGSYLFVFSLGMVFYLNLERINGRKALLILECISILVFLVFIKNNYYLVMFSNPPSVLLILFSLCLYGIIYPLYITIGKHIPAIEKVSVPLAIIGKYSLYIFLYHVLFMDIGKALSDSAALTTNKQIYRIWMMSAAIIVPTLVGVFFEIILPRLRKIDINRIIQWIVPNNPDMDVKKKFSLTSIVWKFIPLVLGWAVYLVAYWPGQLSPDVNNQWNEIIAGRFSDWHPAFHTMVMWLITRVWFSPAAVNFAQILFAAGVIAWTLAILESKGMPKTIGWVSIGIMILSPIFGMMLITPWKDIPYSISVVFLTTLVFLMVNSSGNWAIKPRNWALLGVVSTLVMLFRHNGILVGIFTIIALGIIYRGPRKQLIFSLILCCSIWYGVRGPLYTTLGVARTENQGLQFGFLQLIGRHVIDHTPLTFEQETQINQILPIQEYQKYDCGLQNDITFNPAINLSAISTMDLIKLAAELSIQNPKATIKHLGCTGAYILSITDSLKNTPWTFYEYPTPSMNHWVTRADGWAPNILSNLIDNLIESSLSPTLNWIVWRSAFWLYFFLSALGLYTALSKQWMNLLVSIPLLLNTIPLVFLSSAQSPRYVFSTFLICLLWGMYYVSKSIAILYEQNKNQKFVLVGKSSKFQ